MYLREGKAGPGVGLDVSENGENSCRYQESNPGRSARSLLLYTK